MFYIFQQYYDRREGDRVRHNATFHLISQEHIYALKHAQYSGWWCSKIPNKLTFYTATS